MSLCFVFTNLKNSGFTIFLRKLRLSEQLSSETIVWVVLTRGQVKSRATRSRDFIAVYLIMKADESLSIYNSDRVEAEPFSVLFSMNMIKRPLLRGQKRV